MGASRYSERRAIGEVRGRRQPSESHRVRALRRMKEMLNLRAMGARWGERKASRVPATMSRGTVPARRRMDSPPAWARASRRRRKPGKSQEEPM